MSMVSCNHKCMLNIFIVWRSEIRLLGPAVEQFDLFLIGLILCSKRPRS